MAGTGASYRQSSSGIILPTPIVKIVSNVAPGVNATALETPPNDGGTKHVNADLKELFWMNTVVVTALVDDALLDPALDLEIQLHKWRGRTGVRNASGWTAPADHDPFAGVVGSGSRMLGGQASGILCSRRTRYKITTQGQRVPFNLGGFFRRGIVSYVDAVESEASGTPVALQIPDALLALPIAKPVSVSGLSGRSVQPWCRRQLTGYFAFSFSIADNSGRPDGRLFGPLSATVAAGSSTHPFAPNATTSSIVGYPVADVNPNYRNDFARLWWHERQSER